ncbi:hypothetical protein CU102_22055 [Phyllobacterium brassicacearum]|uniref:DUF768 domain-containing protein n=2 Tax=Phyllobacterium brassicacearum TaxID=314235 RepID=A0A2P7BD19_9HYPH|nr:hypothetical protein CU102_22055 [Phyllobacterium brassicacearum]
MTDNGISSAFDRAIFATFSPSESFVREIGCAKEEHMSQRAIDFVNNWISANVDASRPADMAHHDRRPKQLAAKCFADAEAAGISVSEIKDGLGDLEICMITAIDRAAMAKESRQA